MTHTERVAAYNAISSELINELGVTDTCDVLTASEFPDRHGWYVRINCDGEIITISGEEALPDPKAQEEIKNKIKDELQSHLNLK